MNYHWQRTLLRNLKNKISEAQSIKNETNNLTAAEATLSASTPHRKKSLAERKYSREVQVHYTELLRESKVIEEDNRTSIVIEEEEDNRVSVIIEHEENSLLTLPIEQEEDNLASVSIEEEGENRTTVITEEDWSNNEKEGENNNLTMTSRQEEVATDQVSTDEEVYRNTGRRNSARKKAVFNDHKHLLKDNLKSRDRALSLTIENNKMFDSTTRSISLPTNEYLACKKVSMNACEQEIKEETDIEGSRLSVDGESSSSGDPEVSMVKKTRKRVIPAKTIGMEHLIDIILIDDKDTKKIDDIIPLSVQLANWNKAYKETAV